MGINKQNLVILIILAAGLAALPYLIKSRETGLAQAADDIRQNCRDNQSKEQCYAKAFTQLTKERDMDFAFATLTEVQKMDPAANGCHFIAHSITIAETEKNPDNWKAVMRRAPQNCSYGGAHGALEVHAASFPDGKLPRSEVMTVCDVPDTNNCTHILGHLILVMQNNDIPASTPLCKALPHDERGIFECLTGIFMERITAINLVEHGLADQSSLNWPERLPELKVLCLAQSGIDSVACWKEITHVALVAFSYDPQKMIDFCNLAPASLAREECADHAVGIMAGNKNFDLTRLGDTCAVKTPDGTFQDRCYAQLVSATLSTLPHASGQAVAFCYNLAERFFKECYTMIGNSLYRASSDAKNALQNACLAAPKDYQTLCRNGGPTAFRAGTLD